MNYKLFKNINIIFSILGVGILLVDFFVINEFHIEGVFIMSISLLLLFNAIRLLNEKLRSNKFINIISNLLVLGLVIFDLWSLIVLAFGVGFIGRGFPLIMIFSFFYNLAFIPFIIFDIGKIKKIKNTG